MLIWIHGSSTDKTSINTYRRRQPLVPLQFHGIAESNGGLVIDENSMAGCVKNLCPGKSSHSVKQSQKYYTSFLENDNLFL
jgi:hypothetical protein